MPELVVVLYEYQTIYRQIFTDGRPLPDDPNPTCLMFDPGGEGKIPLIAQSENRFSMEGTIIEFVRDASGAVTGYITHLTEGDRYGTTCRRVPVDRH